MATTQGEIRVGPQNQVKDVYVRETKKTVTFKIFTYFYISKLYATEKGIPIIKQFKTH